MVYLIEINRFPDECVIHRLDMDRGKYLMPYVIKEGNSPQWIREVIAMISKDLPSQIIFDEYGMGALFKNHLAHELGGLIKENGVMVYR